MNNYPTAIYKFSFGTVDLDEAINELDSYLPWQQYEIQNALIHHWSEVGKWQEVNETEMTDEELEEIGLNQLPSKDERQSRETHLCLETGTSVMTRIYNPVDDIPF